MRTPFANEGKNNSLSQRHAITSNALTACYSKGLGAKPKPSNKNLKICVRRSVNRAPDL